MGKNIVAWIVLLLMILETANGLLSLNRLSHPSLKRFFCPSYTDFSRTLYCSTSTSISNSDNLDGGSTNTVLSNGDLLAEIIAASTNADKLSLETTFAAFANNKDFVKNIWQKKPFLCPQSLPNVAGAYTMAEVETAVNSDFLEAGRGTFKDGSGWNMASVSKPRGTSFEDAKLRFEDVQMAMMQKGGTVVFNSAGGFIPPLASVCLDALQAFQYPTALNMYLTNAGQVTSAPPHTDKQDVFVLQTQGQKRWRVFAPPPPSRMQRADPFARGKGSNSLELTELEAPLIDVTLKAGQVLYVPGGFPHTTDTVTGIDANGDPSVHLTVGVDTHIWNLDLASTRRLALSYAGVEDKVLLTKLDSILYWELQMALPTGFLGVDIGAPFKGFPSAVREAQAGALVKQLIPYIKKIEPQRWGSLNEEEIIETLKLNEVSKKILQYHEEVTDMFGRMYADVAFKISPSKMDLSFFRSQPYFQNLESLAENLELWADKQKIKSTPPKPLKAKANGFGKK